MTDTLKDNTEYAKRQTEVELRTLIANEKARADAAEEELRVAQATTRAALSLISFLISSLPE